MNEDYLNTNNGQHIKGITSTNTQEDEMNEESLNTNNGQDIKGITSTNKQEDIIEEEKIKINSKKKSNNKTQEFIKKYK